MAKKALEAPGLGAEFADELAKAGLTGFFRKVLDREDMTVDTLTTGLPRLDKILHDKKLGLARGRRVEIYSRDPEEVGKTSLALQIGVHWQRLGQKVAIVDIEDTITEDYLVELGYVLEPAEQSGMYPVYVAKGFDEETGEVLSAEEIADKVGAISRIVDLVIIDSIGSLAKRADLEKESGEATMGGIGKLPEKQQCQGDQYLDQPGAAADWCVQPGGDQIQDIRRERYPVLCQYPFGVEADREVEGEQR
jgi:RecA/RadA recombinase